MTRTLTLKITRWNVFKFGNNQRDMIRASRDAVTAPTDGPNQSVAANTNGSETDNRATSTGILTVKDPVSTVRAASASQAGDGGRRNRSSNAHPRTHTTRKGIILKYARP